MKSSRKTCKLYDKDEREIRRIDLLSRRETARYEHRRRGISYVKYKTTRFPFSGARQNARYARQIAAGQLRMAGV